MEVARCFTTALIFEAAAHPKPGLVDRVRGLSELDIFRLSASAAALNPFFAVAAKMGRTGQVKNRLGGVILKAVEEALRVQRGGNTHLGAILLAIPLAAGAGALGGNACTLTGMRRAAASVLEELSWLDATNIFKAISLASPGGLGRVPFLDVNDQRTYRLLRMKKPSFLETFEPYRGRDMVSDELLDNYPLLFEKAFKTMVFWEKKSGSVEKAFVNALLSVMAARPDTHIERRRGVHIARLAQHMAATVLALGGAASEKGLEALREMDLYLRRVDARPGSSADILSSAIGVRLLLGLRI